MQANPWNKTSNAESEIQSVRDVHLLNHNNLVETELLRASVSVKSLITLPSLVGMTIASCAIGFFLWNRVPIANIFLWNGPVLLGLALRYWMARNVVRDIDTWQESDLTGMNRKLYFSSMLNQLLVGSGMWSIAYGNSPYVELFVTAIICLYGVGVMTNLSSDFKTFSHTAPALLAQPLLFWLLKGEDGLPIAAAISLMLLLGLRMIHFSSQTFRDSVLIRYEKNQLLDQFEGAQKQAQNALQSAQKANKMKDFFMAAAGHDLRQPLFVIGLLNETMMMRNPDEKTKELLRKQQTSIASLGHLFDSLLDLSQFEQGQIRPYPVEFNISHLCLSLVEEFELACEKKGLEFDCNHMDQKVFTDFDLIARVLRNLFTNAVRYTSNGKISISGTTTTEGFEITLQDTGIGIPPEKQQAIFDEFVQLDKGESGSEAGVGMGLAIVKQITRLLDIDLDLTSVPGEGTTFRFTLPIGNPAKKSAKTKAHT